MAHPDWVMKHKIPGADIRCIRGRYYMYKITSVWDPKKKRSQKTTVGMMGVIDEEYGFIPKGMSRRGRVPKGQSKIKDTSFAESDFMDKFESVDDPRSERNQLHKFEEILLVTFLAIICGADGWQDVENYGKNKIDFLRQYYDYKNGIPSDDTVRRLFRSINPEQFKEVFSNWMKHLVKAVDAQVIAIDGKSSRRSYDDESKMLHVVSAFATEARIVLGQEKVAKKSNEITAIPKLIKLLDIKGHIITIDAMGCQYTIADQIVEAGGDYIFALKGNQGRLSEDVKLYFEGTNHQKKLESFTDYDKGHGRIETRKCIVCNDIEWLQNMHPKWKTIKSMIQIDSIRELKDKATREIRYYVSSLDASAEKVSKAVRSHWGIENSLHWVLDMSFNEDYSRIRKGNAPHVMAIIRHFALNLLQKNKPANQSIKGFRKMCAWNDMLVDKLIYNNLN